MHAKLINAGHILAVCQNMTHRLGNIINKLVPNRANFGECEALARAAISTVRCYGLLVGPIQKGDSGIQERSRRLLVMHQRKQSDSTFVIET
jgi:hypothetical protein